MLMSHSSFAGHHALSSFTLLAAVVALNLSACGSRGSEDVQYSTLKQHIMKGEVREVHMSATEVEAKHRLSI